MELFFASVLTLGLTGEQVRLEYGPECWLSVRFERAGYRVAAPVSYHITGMFRSSVRSVVYRAKSRDHVSAADLRAAVMSVYRAPCLVLP